MRSDDCSTGTHTEQTCSFCGKKYPQGTKLIAGPGILICTECVELCNELEEAEGRGMTQ